MQGTHSKALFHAPQIWLIQTEVLFLNIISVEIDLLLMARNKAATVTSKHNETISNHNNSLDNFILQ